MERDEHLKQDLLEFQKEKERIRNIVGEVGGSNSKQHRLINRIFLIIILILLVLGVVLKKITLVLTIQIASILGIFKIIWMFYESQRANHFQFWILNSLEYKIDEMDRRLKKIEKMLNNK